MHYPKSGPNSVAEYQVSGLPFVTSSQAGTSTPVQISFPYVTKFITIKNNGGGALYFGFTSNGVSRGNKFSLANNDIVTLEVKAKDLFFLGSGGARDFSLVAGLTMIETNMFPVLTGSGMSGSLDPTAFGYPGLG